ncbi:MAG TPA: dephospho-CoA kinase [Solirubrobacteraceae bacterium]|nr:dephospho-CoA kinase [Solirubrobacteraceae bacterium]
MVPWIGLTGGIGAGKSTACAALERLGAICLSTDQVVHDLYESPEIRDAVAARFGSEVIADGRVDRPALARAAFATDEGRGWLEQLLWPRVGERVAAFRTEADTAQPPPRAAVVEIPLLFESGSDHGFDATIAVIADEAIRHERAAARGHEALSERAARQLSQQEKSQRATYTVVNDGSERELQARLSAILDMLPSADPPAP